MYNNKPIEQPRTLKHHNYLYMSHHQYINYQNIVQENIENQIDIGYVWMGGKYFSLENAKKIEFSFVIKLKEINTPGVNRVLGINYNFFKL